MLSSMSARNFFINVHLTLLDAPGGAGLRSVYRFVFFHQRLYLLFESLKFFGGQFINFTAVFGNELLLDLLLFLHYQLIDLSAGILNALAHQLLRSRIKAFKALRICRKRERLIGVVGDGDVLLHFLNIR